MSRRTGEPNLKQECKWNSIEFVLIKDMKATHIDQSGSYFKRAQNHNKHSEMN